MKNLIRPIIELTILFLTIFAAFSWIYYPSQQYEPLLVLLGATSLGCTMFDRYRGKLFHTEQKSFSASELIQHSEKLRVPLQEEIYKCRAEKLRKDVIIRHVSRHDKYPNVEDKKGISPWFKVGLMDMYHKGIKVGLSWMDLKKCSEGYRIVNSSNGEQRDVRAILIGEIPFSAIETINIEGDEYYSYPHIFCFFPFKRQPYERLVFCEEIDMGHGHPYFKELAEYEDVRKNSENIPNYYFRKKRSFFSSFFSFLR